MEEKRAALAIRVAALEQSRRVDGAAIDKADVSSRPFAQAATGRFFSVLMASCLVSLFGPSHTRAARAHGQLAGDPNRVVGREEG
jgi:hypothetical protein